VQVDASRWSGEGTFTATLLDRLKAVPAIDYIRVEDAAASHADVNYNFISNEVYVRFRSERASEPGRLLGVLPVPRMVWREAMTLEQLERELAATDVVGSPDYADDAMLQYLRTERIVPPYQTRGYKLVELVRVYRLMPSR
jgi:hypothetical protein